MTQPAPLKWRQAKPNLWRSDCGAYAIVATVLPEDRARPTTTYTLRGIDADLASAYPGTLGYFIEERYKLEEAKSAAETHAYTAANRDSASIPEDHPADELVRFFWPISEGVTRGGLARVVDEDGQVRVQLLGMARGEADETGECRYRPVVFAELGVPAWQPVTDEFA